MGEKMTRVPGLVMAAAVAAACVPIAAAGQSQTTVFKIGQFDGSSVEFKPGLPKEPVVYNADGTDRATDWYGRQSLTAPGLAAGAESDPGAGPRKVIFALATKPKGSFHLRVAILIESPGVPVLHVDINGKTGNVYFAPKLDYGAGDSIGESNPIYSRAEGEVELPAAYLHEGTNTLALQAFSDDPGVSAQAHLDYDAIELDRAVEPARADSSATIVPTVFFRRAGGGLQEEVDAMLRFNAPYTPSQAAVLTIGGARYEGVLGTSGDFGEVKVPFLVREFPKGTDAALVWRSDGKRQQTHSTIDPCKKWTLYLVPHVHLDVGFTDYQAKVASSQSRIIDEALGFMARNPDFRFSMDGSWNIEQFFRERTAPEQEKAIAAIREQHLFVPAQYANVLTGVASLEALVRSLYFSADFSRKYGTPFNYANIADVPSYSWSYASVLASAGIHTFAAASNNTRAPVLLQGHLNQASPFWWEGPDGQRVLTWYSRTYLQMQYLFGLPPSVSSGRETVPVYLEAYDTARYRADSVILFGTQVENTDLFPQQATLAEDWNKQFAYPEMRYSGFYDAVQSIAREFGGDLPVVQGDGAPYWEDGAASDSLYTAMERETEPRAVSAEELATLSSLLIPGVAADQATLRRMWQNIILMDEHTWGAFDSISDPGSDEAVSQLEVKDKMAIDADAESEFVARNAMATIAGSVAAPRGAVIVFNLLNWARPGQIEMDIAKHSRIVDPASGADVPFEVMHHRVNLDHVRLITPEVPALGYKVLSVVPGDAEPASSAEDQTKTTLESAWYRVVLDPESGAVVSIYDKDLHREMVDRDSPYRFGQYLYVTGGNQQPNKLVRNNGSAPIAELSVHPAASGRLVAVRRTPWGEMATIESSAPNTPEVVSEIEVFDREKKIEFREEVTRTGTTAKEAAYFAFPFAARSPRFRYEIQNGEVDPASNLYPGAGHEWYSVQHWVTVLDEAGAAGTVMPLDAPLVTLGDINRGLWPSEFNAKSSTVFSYIMNNYWFTNYRASQSGTFRFRYVVTSDRAYDPVELSRKGWEEASRLQVDQVRAQDVAGQRQFSAADDQKSFIGVEDPAVLLETWKPAEDGNGTIMRLLDLGGTSRTVTVTTPLLGQNRAWLTDAVENGGSPLTMTGSSGFETPIHPHAIVTIRLAPANSKPRNAAEGN